MEVEEGNTIIQDIVVQVYPSTLASLYNKWVNYNSIYNRVQTYKQKLDYLLNEPIELIGRPMESKNEKEKKIGLRFQRAKMTG